MKKEIKDLLTQVENLGWKVEEEGDNEYRFGKYSPAGQDYSISVNGETYEELMQSIDQAYEDYDVSEETYLWLDNTGHGKNGAPFHMKDVLADMEACKEMILTLSKGLALSNELDY
ncbi:hypothetical protein AAGG74_17710 [Bacillus mexicanus]|uniref:hypothetical protein n=1 Tax=Bacillus mexicanus TaxID=2834415 RepID=UPI003D231151